MKTDIPRCDGPNPSPGETCAPERWTWHSMIGLAAPLLDLGRTPEQAEERLFASLLRFFATDADPLPDDPQVRARDELASYKRGALLSATASTEVGAFLAWRQVCSLSPGEAFRVWREVFAAPAEGADPLLRLIGRPGDEEPPVRARTRKRRA